jgi:holo-[acyl-carrier protein] synthase
MLFVGVDIIEIDRIQDAIARWGERFLGRVYTEAELEVCRGRTPALAVRFAAKEAVMKALGTGTNGVGWQDIEVLPNPDGKPLVFLHRGARKKSVELGMTHLDLSLSHSHHYAVASAVGGRIEDSNPR